MTPRTSSGALPGLETEHSLRKQGAVRIAGLDEAGRGALAGPVVAAAVVLPIERPDLSERLAGVRDSKQLSPPARARAAALIRRIALACGLGSATSSEIDGLGVVPATRLAMQRALESLQTSPDYLLLDHISLPQSRLAQRSITRGDASVLSIAAASVLAKVARDEAMAAAEDRYPGYGFARHKGYGTAAHQAALERLGPCPLHRQSFAPVAASALLRIGTPIEVRQAQSREPGPT